MDFDPAKDAANIAKHGVSLARADDFELVAFEADDRATYGEPRWRAWGLIDGVPHALAFTVRHGELRPISLRRYHLKEYSRHAPRR